MGETCSKMWKWRILETFSLKTLREKKNLEIQAYVEEYTNKFGLIEIWREVLGWIELTRLWQYYDKFSGFIVTNF